MDSTLAARCRACHSNKTQKFPMENCVHLVGMENINHPGILIFEPLTVCLDCGFAEFSLTSEQLEELRRY